MIVKVSSMSIDGSLVASKVITSLRWVNAVSKPTPHAKGWMDRPISPRTRPRQFKKKKKTKKCKEQLVDKWHLLFGHIYSVLYRRRIACITRFKNPQNRLLDEVSTLTGRCKNLNTSGVEEINFSKVTLISSFELEDISFSKTDLNWSLDTLWRFNIFIVLMIRSLILTWFRWMLAISIGNLRSRLVGSKNCSTIP